MVIFFFFFFFTILHNFCDFLFAFLHTKPLLRKGVDPKRKKSACKGSKFFPFRIDPFSKRRQKHDHFNKKRIYWKFEDFED